LGTFKNEVDPMSGKIEIKISIFTKNLEGYQMIAEDGVKFALFSFSSKEELKSFLEGFKEGIRFINPNSFVHIQKSTNF
jgi:hypothetical protein